MFDELEGFDMLEEMVLLFFLLFVVGKKGMRGHFSEGMRRA